MEKNDVRVENCVFFHFSVVQKLSNGVKAAVVDLRGGPAVKYFLDEIDRLASPGYIPTAKDVSLAPPSRVEGLYELRFQVRGIEYNIVNIASQQFDRWKVIPQFQDVKLIIHCVNLESFNSRLPFDESYVTVLL